MTKKDICLQHETIATYYVCVWVGIEIKAIEYGINDSIYFVSYEGDTIKYHKARIYYENGDYDDELGDYEDKSYFMWGKMKVLLSDCMRVM